MKPVVRSDFARLALSFQGTTNTTRHSRFSVAGFEIPVPGFENSIAGFEFSIGGFGKGGWRNERNSIPIDCITLLSIFPLYQSLHVLQVLVRGVSLIHSIPKALQNYSVFGIEMSKWAQSGM